MSNVGQLSGGSSGSVTGQLDVQWIVEQIIYAKQQPIRDLETYEIFYEAKKEAFQELNTRVSAVESSLYNMNVTSFDTKSATLSSEDYFTASVSTSAAPAEYSIKVGQLAQAESYTGDALVTDADDTSVFDAIGDKTFTITPRDGSDAVSIDVSGKSLNDLRNEINSSGLDVSASVVQYGDSDYRLVLTADTTGEDEGFTLSGDAAGAAGLDMDQKVANLDAQIYVNNPDEAISRSSNTIDDVIGGVTFNLKDYDAGLTDTTTLTIGTDTTGLKENIQTFVDAYNDAIDFLNEQFTFNEAQERAGVLSGEAAARKVKSDLLQLATSRVEGHDGSNSYNSFAIIGLEMDRTGHLEINDEKLDDAIENHLDEVRRILTDEGSSTYSDVTYIGGTDDTVGGTYAVHIDQVAEQASVSGGTDIAATLGQDETLTITYAGNDYTVDLTSGMDEDAVLNAINSEFGSTVPVTARVSSGKLELYTDDHGTSQTIKVVSDVAAGGGGTGIGTTQLSDTGQDVAGTIGGNAASGNGRLLTSTTGNSKGLMVSISASSLNDPINGDDKGTVNVTKGVAEKIRESMYELSFPYTGLLAKNIESFETQLDNIADKIKNINRNLASEQEILISQFTKANEALAQMTYLQSTLSNNFK